METKETKDVELGKANLFDLTNRIFVKSKKSKHANINSDDCQYIEKLLDRIGATDKFESLDEMKVLTTIAMKYLTPEEKKLLRHGDVVQMTEGEHNDGFYLWNHNEQQLCSLSLDYRDYGNISSQFPINSISGGHSHYYYGLLPRNSDIIWFDTRGYKFTPIYSKYFTCYLAARVSDSTSSSSSSSSFVSSTSVAPSSSVGETNPWYIITNFPPEQLAAGEKLLCRGTNDDEEDEEDRYGLVISDMQDAMSGSERSSKVEKSSYDAAEKFIEKLTKELHLPEDRILVTIVDNKLGRLHRDDENGDSNDEEE